MRAKGTIKSARFYIHPPDRARLRRNIDKGSHTVLCAARGGGKNALVLQTLAGLQASERYAVGTTDFLTVYDGPSVQRAILKCIGEASPSLLGNHDGAARLVNEVFRNLRPLIEINEDGRARLRLNLNPNQPETIIDALMGLDQLAVAGKKRVVLFIDEFQQLGEIRHHVSIEGMIRHAMERMRRTTVIISGSNRHALQRMLDDRGRPLYQLCDRLVLEPLSSADLLPIIQGAARAKWGRPLQDGAAREILECTQSHGVYLNALLDQLWARKSLPSAKTVKDMWATFVSAESSRMRAELVTLSPNQRGLLQALAGKPTACPTARVFLTQTRLAQSSVRQSLSILCERDLVHRSLDDQYRIRDPAMEMYVRQHLR